LFALDLEDLDALREDDPELYESYVALTKAVEQNPMSESARRGMTLFAGKATCTACHVGANFTDEQYHNLGVGMEAEKPDLGRYEITKEENARGAFKTPTLRNIALSPPYMHDGSQATLEEVMKWYNIGGHKNKWLSDKMKPLNLTDQEVLDVVAFMVEGLTGEFPQVETGRLPK
jgi:cytochrome c peroxidase